MTKKMGLMALGLSVVLLSGCGAVDDLIENYAGDEDEGIENYAGDEIDGTGTILGFPSPEGGYNVYGGNGAIGDLSNVTFLGDGIDTDVFSGSYDYYVIGNDGEGSPIEIDSIGGSNGEYYPVVVSSNVGDTYGNVEGPPDGVYTTITAQGYVVIDASGDDLESITVFTDN